MKTTRSIAIRALAAAAVLSAIVLTGAYTYDGSILSVYVALVFGLIGYAMRKLGFSPAAAMLGLVLGPIVEVSLRRGLALYDGDVTVFLTRPGSLALIVLSVVTFVVPLLRRPASEPRPVLAD